LIALLRREAQRYLSQPNVTSVGIGYKVKDGKPTDQLSIQFTVEKKVLPEGLEAEGFEALPPSFTDTDGTVVPTDVIRRKYRQGVVILPETQTEAVSPAKKRRKKMNPIRPGISVAHEQETAGTIGGIVFDEETGEPYILSNWHVLVGPSGQPGDTILQPGPADGGDVFSARVETLVRSHLGLAGDCAVARIENRKFNRSIFETNTTPKRLGKVNLGDAVVKSGRTTGVTFGIVRRVGVVVSLNYGTGDPVQIGGFEITPNPAKPPVDGEISKGGDSGSFWMIDSADDTKDVVVGLHFAGETDPDPEAEHALACSIHSVVEKLHVSLAPQPGLQSSSEGTGALSAAAPTTAEGDLPLLTAEGLAEIERRLDSDPKGTLRKMRRIWDSTLTEQQLRTALDRARFTLRNPGSTRESLAAEAAVVEALPAGFSFPGMDPAIEINPEDHKFEEAGDLFRWILLGGSGVLFPGDRVPFREHVSFPSQFVYPMRDPAPGQPVEVPVLSDFGTGRYHSRATFITQGARTSFATISTVPWNRC
jgi:hypothetical protein